MDVPSTYEIRQPPEDPQAAGRGKIIVIAMAVITILVVANVISVVLFETKLNDLTSIQGVQIRQLYQANSRLADQLSAQSTQMSAGLAASNPAADSNLITCRDLKSMALVATNGGSVSAVPGSVSLSQSAVPMPGHCRK